MSGNGPGPPAHMGRLSTETWGPRSGPGPNFLRRNGANAKDVPENCHGEVAAALTLRRLRMALRRCAKSATLYLNVRTGMNL
jgi:hypothetical protein